MNDNERTLRLEIRRLNKIINKRNNTIQALAGKIQYLHKMSDTETQNFKHLMEE